MRKKVLIAGVLLLLLGLAMGLGGCERAKPAPTATSQVEIEPGETPGGSPTAPPVTPVTPPEESAIPSPQPETTPTSVPAEATSIPAAPATPVPAEGIQYVVRWGDTIYLIASRYGVSVEDIVDANGLGNPDLIRAGDVLIIPGASAPSDAPGVHIVRRGENLQSIAQMYGITVDAIARANGIVNPNYIYVGQRLTIPGATAESTGGQTYVVQQGDTLSSIAVRFGTTAWAIAYANNLPNVNIIYVGQTLYIP